MAEQEGSWRHRFPARWRLVRGIIHGGRIERLDNRIGRDSLGDQFCQPGPSLVRADRGSLACRAENCHARGAVVQQFARMQGKTAKIDLTIGREWRQKGRRDAEFLQLTFLIARANIRR